MGQCPSNIQPITRDILLSMLKRENELRLSDKVLDMLEREVSIEHKNENYYRDAEYNDCNCVYDASKNLVFTSQVIKNLQKQVISEFGYNINDKNILNYCLEILHSALYLYPNDNEILNSVYYLKYNRAKQGNFKIGDKFLDIKSLLYYNKFLNKLKNISLSKIIENGGINNRINSINQKCANYATLILCGSMT